MTSIRPILDFLAGEITDRHARQHPEVFARYGAAGKIRCREDARFHLEYLDAALEAGEAQFFLDYIAWAKIMLAARGIPPGDLLQNLRIIDDVLRERLDDSAPASALLREAIRQLPAMPETVPSFIGDAAPTAALARDYLRALLDGNKAGATAMIDGALQSGTTVRALYRGVFEPVQKEIGRLWQINQISVAQEHFCTAATETIMAAVQSRLMAGVASRRTVVAMCAGGEQHEIGLRIISDLLELEGWRTHYLGANVPPAAAVLMCADRAASFLLISATTPPHIPAVAEVIRQFRANPGLASAKVVVGGRAFAAAPALWRRLGADGYGANADECLEILETLAAA
jgi:methanogenic corrinoid protein MtbC1